MIELLILYILSKREKTVYALRRDIIDSFGMITKPSLGTIHPALKRLFSKDAVKFEQKYTEGGKKSTYYSLAQNGKRVFKELFFEDISSNPTIFHTQLSTRLLTVSMLEKSERAKFFEELQKNLELQKIEAEKALESPYHDYDEWQKGVISETLSGIASIEALVERLKVY